MAGILVAYGLMGLFWALALYLNRSFIIALHYLLLLALILDTLYTYLCYTTKRWANAGEDSRSCCITI